MHSPLALRLSRIAALCCSLLLSSAAALAAGSDYVGAAVCARCHQPRFEQFRAGNHFTSWKTVDFLDQVEGLPQSISEGENNYSIQKVDGSWKFLLQLGGRPPQVLPVHSVIGGKRLGVSLVLAVSQVEDRPLAHTALVEARYMVGTDGRLKRSPGFGSEVAQDYELAVGQVMSPEFADKCLGCHGGPVESDLAAAGGPHPRFLDTSVTCERCHGAGKQHVAAAEAKKTDLEILHPGKLTSSGLHAVCAECHSGFFALVQPRPEDIRIANQVTALENSECFVQSGGEISCLTCHNPHENARPRGAEYDQRCLECHSTREAVRTVCPVNANSDCIRCHMPEVILPGDFHLTDHWIRVAR